MMVHQEARCPVCRAAFDLAQKDFVALGQSINCKNGCGPFTASGDTVTCCMEDADGMVQLPLRAL